MTTTRDAAMWLGIIKRDEMKNGWRSEFMADLKRDYRRILRRAPVRQKLPLIAEERTIATSDESLATYRIYPGKWSKNDIEELVEDMTIRINSPYDCTGKLFTEYIHAEPCNIGLVVVHHMSIDV